MHRMKPPKDIWDRSPLEQEPFLTQFKIRNIAGSRRGDNWFAPLAKGIQDDSSQRPAAVQWSKLAFPTEPKGKTSRVSNPRPSPKELSASIESFVRFYWALYNDDEEGALEVVNRERKNRKCGYQLELPCKGSQLTQGAGTSQPQCGPSNVSHAQSSEPWRSGGSRGTRAQRKGRKKTRGGPGAASGKSKDDAADGPREPAVAGGSGGIKVAARRGDGGQAAQMVPVVAETICPSSEVAVCASYAAMDFPEEDKGVVVFRGDLDAAAFVDDHSHPHGGSPSTSVARELFSDNHALEASPTPTAVSRATPSDASGTTAVDITDPESTETPTQSDKPRRKKARKEAPQEPTRERPPRAASNQERLSQLAKVELEYHSKAKRGLVDDLEDLIPAPRGSQHSVTALPTRRAKKSKLRAPSEDRDDSMSPPEADGAPDATPESVFTTLPSGFGITPDASNDTGPEPEPAAKRSRRRKKRDASRKERKIPGIDTSTRPSKRQKMKDSKVNPTGGSGDATSQEERRRKKPSTAYTQADRVPPMSSSDTSSLGLGDGLETASNQPPIEAAASSPNASEKDPMVPAPRPIANLPRLQGIRRGLPGLGAAGSGPARIGMPANLLEMDRILSGAATDGDMMLKYTVRNTDEWTTDLEAQDAPPDSDDEEEIPLSQIASSRPKVHDIAACETDGTEPIEEPPVPDIMSIDPGHLLLPDASPPSPPGPPASRVTIASPIIPPWSATTAALPIASIQASPPPPVIPTLAAVRVPRPIPPPVPQKKPLTARPTIWAKSRQEVCESFDWFRSYQSGVYHANDIVKGYLLSAFSASRDLFARDGRLIISHGGGKAESLHSAKGQATLLKASDQEEGDKSVRALLRTYRMGRPVALLIDDRYALFPYDLSSKPGCTYVVLGFYHIAHAWAERQPADNNIGFVVRYKFAFEWCDKQPEPWWVKQDESASLETCSIPAPPKEDNPITAYCRCASCHKPSPLIYEQGWMCLRPKCPAFWTLLDGRPTPQDLTYSDAFLNATYPCNHEDLEDIAPQPPAAAATNGVVTSRRFTKGWHCKDCGRLSCRYKWQHWECQNCGSALQVIGKNRVPNEFWSQQNPGFLHHKIAADSGIQASRLLTYGVGNNLGNYHVYVLPQNRGRIYLILGSPRINGLANEIFQEYQDQAVSGELQFRRWPLRSHHCRGELLTNYFSQNTGEPYQYVGGTANTIPFDSAPSAVVKARELIESRMMDVMKAESQPYHFNEVLSAAYMEEQRMAFHSDAENGLGPRVASLSLGSAALMHFRPLKKYRKDSGGGQKCNALTLFLKHGDVLIMDGAEVQEYYEHTVVPLNFRIAATARYINNRNH